MKQPSHSTLLLPADRDDAAARAAASAIADTTSDQNVFGMEEEHPRGALAFMLVYLVLLALLWTHVYLKLWAVGR